MIMEMKKKKPLRERLNEFQLDWAQAAVRSGLIKAEKVRKKKILLIGDTDSLIDAIAWSFEAWNDKCNAEISIAFMTMDGEIRQYAGINFLPEKADYVILTGYCCREIPGSAGEELEYLERYFELVRTVTTYACEKVLLLSDGRVYGQLGHGFIASEYEAGRTDPCGREYEAQYFEQALESMLISCAREAHVKYQILRTGLLFGAYIESTNQIIYHLARTVAEKQEDMRFFTTKRDSYTSIHDMLSAVHFLLTSCPGDKIFNVKSLQSDVSESEMVTLLHQNFPDHCKISLQWDKEKVSEGGIMLNSQLLERYGFVPRITLEDGLIILVKSLQKKNEIFIFDDTYLGKLTSVQQILLGYLLEIDRICKKYGIKYFLAGGTLLGAIRHHGFIPWDDDADVMMLREDYNHFLMVAQDELPDNIFLQLPSTEEGNHNIIYFKISGYA